MRYVRETAAGKSISAYVILNRKGQHVATVQTSYANSGGVLVNVFNHGDEVCARTARAMGFKLDESGRIAEGRAMGSWPYTIAGTLAGRASGYGYDKFTAALSGLFIDGHAMSNHCSRSGAPKPPKGRKIFPADYKPPKGYSLANYMPADRSPDGMAGYHDCYRLDGLKYLEALGYRVIQAV